MSFERTCAGCRERRGLPGPQPCGRCGEITKTVLRWIEDPDRRRESSPCAPGVCAGRPGSGPRHCAGGSPVGTGEALVSAFLPAGSVGPSLHSPPLKASFSDRCGRARMGRAELGGSLHSRSVWGPLLGCADYLFPGVLPRFYFLKRRWTMMTATVTKGTYPRAPITVRHPNPWYSPQ